MAMAKPGQSFGYQGDRFGGSLAGRGGKESAGGRASVKVLTSNRDMPGLRDERHALFSRPIVRPRCAQVPPSAGGARADNSIRDMGEQENKGNPSVPPRFLEAPCEAAEGAGSGQGSAGNAR